MAVLKSTTDGVIWAKVNGQQGARGPVGSSGPAAVGRNRIINGDFSVNQRGEVSGNAVPVRYGHDAWRLLATGPADAAWYHLNTFAPGELNESAKYYAGLDIGAPQSTASDYSIFYQPIESVRTLSGKTVTLSFWAKGSVAGRKIGVELWQHFGSGGSGSVGTSLGAVPITTTWARYSITGALPSLTGKTIGTPPDLLGVHLWISAGANHAARASSIGIQIGMTSIWGVQLEEGSVATPYEQKHYWHELRNCQRYFQKWQQPVLRGVVNSAVLLGRMGMVLPIPMRAVPVATISGAIAVWSADFGTTVSSIAGQFNNPQALEFDLNTPSGFQLAGRPALSYQSGGGYMDVNAELP